MQTGSLQYGVMCLTLLSLASVSYAIKCFQCNSGVDPHCVNLKANDTSSKYYRQCELPTDISKNTNMTGKVLFCRKISQLIKDMQDTVRVIRKCGWEKSPKTDCYKFEDDDHKEIVCQCFSDGCNSAHSFVIYRWSTYFIFVTFVTVMIQRLYQ